MKTQSKIRIQSSYLFYGTTKNRLFTALLAFFLMPMSVFANDDAFGQPCHIEIDVVAKENVEESLDHNFKEVRFAISKCPAVIAKANSLSSKSKYISKSLLTDGTYAHYLMFRDKFFQYTPTVNSAEFWTTDKEWVNKDRVASYSYDERWKGYDYSFSTRGKMSTPMGYRWNIPSDYNFNTVDKRKFFPNRLLNSVVLGKNYMFFSDLLSNAEFFQLVNMLERGNYEVIFSVGERSVVN